MYMLCTCLTIMYMLLTFSFSEFLPSFYLTMYMFVQNSKKIIQCVDKFPKSLEKAT